jgi:transcriptional regulatory protein RtcR
VIEVCIRHKNQAAAGRYLYANSRDKLKNPNDSDRLRKYLMKFGLRFDELKFDGLDNGFNQSVGQYR